MTEPITTVGMRCSNEAQAYKRGSHDIMDVNDLQDIEDVFTLTP